MARGQLAGRQAEGMVGEMIEWTFGGRALRGKTLDFAAGLQTRQRTTNALACLAAADEPACFAGSRSYCRLSHAFVGSHTSLEEGRELPPRPPKRIKYGTPSATLFRTSPTRKKWVVRQRDITGPCFRVRPFVARMRRLGRAHGRRLGVST